MATSRRQIREWVAKKLGRYNEISISVDGSVTTLYDAPGISDAEADDERAVDSYLILRDDSAEPEWRRITAVHMALEQISINRAFDTAPADNTSAAVIGLLTPKQWNEAINEALTVLYFPDRHEITLTTTTNANGTVTTTREYELPSWVLTRGQVRGFRYRHTTTSREDTVPRWRITEAITGLTVVLMDLPSAVSTYTLILEATRWHSRLDQDDWGTTCPLPLWQAAVEVAAIHKVYKQYGDVFKRQFAQDLAIAERALLQMRGAILPTVMTQEYTTEDDWGGPDIDDFFDSRDGWW